MPTSAQIKAIVLHSQQLARTGYAEKQAAFDRMALKKAHVLDLIKAGRKEGHAAGLMDALFMLGVTQSDIDDALAGAKE